MEAKMIRAAIAAICVAATLPSWAGEVNWIGGSGGTEDAPLELYKASNWSNNALPSTANRYSLSVDSPTVLTNSAGIATKIADWMRFASGDFTVLGGLQIAVLGWNQPAGTATLVKKGDWLVTHEFVLGYNSGSYFALTNYSGSLTRSTASSPFDIARAGNTTAIVENLAGDWNITVDNFNVGLGSNSRGELHFKGGNLTVSGTVNIGAGSGSHGEFRSQSGNHSFNKGLTIAGAGNSTGIVEKDDGDWMVKGASLYVGKASGANGEFYHRGGSFEIATYGVIGDNASVAKAYFEISGGAVTNSTGYLQVGNNGPGTLAVKSGGRFVRIGEADGASLWLSMRIGPGTLNVEGGEVLLGGALGCHYYGNGNGTSAVNVTDGGVLTMSRIYQRTGTYAVNVLIDDGTLRAYADRTDFLPNASYLTVKVGNGGATFDADFHDITIAKEIIDADGESGPVTFAGDGGTIRLTGALNTTGAINLNEKTHLVAKDASMKSAILSRGITVLKPRRGSAKGTFTLFSVADGTPCTAADLASVTLGPGLTGATLSIVDGAITIEVSHSMQTWSGPAGTSALWSGLNWDDGEAFDDGNEALFATANAIAEVDQNADVLTLTFNENATLSGSGTLTVPTVEVASGVSATISAPTEGPLEKTGAGTLTLGASRTTQTTVSEGTLAMTGGATLSANGLVLGADPTKPITIDYGGGTLAINPVNLIGTGCEATFRNGTFGSGSFAIANGKTLRLGPGAKMTLTSYTDVGNGSVGFFEIDGAEVTNTAMYVQIGYNSTGTMTIKNGGRFTRVGEQDGASLWVSMRGDGSGTLNLQGGEMFLGGALGFHYYSGNGVSALNVTDGGVLTMSRMYQKSGTSAVNVLIDDGTLRAYEDNTAFIPNQSCIRVMIGADGGTIDANGKKITIAKQLSGTGGVTYRGGGIVTLSAAPAYSGKTTVEVGTSLVVPASISGANLAFTIPEGLAPGVYEVVSVSGNGSFAADVLSTATLPEDANVRFILSGDGKRIYCAYGSGVNEQVWIGGASGSLDVAANWLSGSVPTSGAAIIGSASPATLTNPAGSVFAPASITFAAGSAAVAIGAADGEPLMGVIAVTNLSSASHTINVPVHFAGAIQVKQEAMAEIDDLAKTHVTFAGGAYAAPGHALESGNSPAVYSRCIFGVYHLDPPASNPWTVVYQGNNRRVCLAGNSALYVPYAGMLTEIYVGNGAKVNVGSSSISTSGHRMSLKNFGEMVVTNLTVTATGDKFTTYNQGTSVPAVFKFESVTNAMTRNCFYFGDGYAASRGIFYFGAGGLNFSSSAVGSYCIGSNYADDAQTVRPWYSDFTIRDRGDGNYGLVLVRNVTFCTDDESGVGRTITIDAITRATGSPVVTVSGSGTLRVNKAANNNAQPTVAVKDTATLAIKPGAILGTGATTVAGGAALQVAESGTLALGGNLTLADGAALGFNFTEKTVPLLDATGKTVTLGANGTVVVKVMAAEGARAKGGANVLTAGGKFANANVTLAEGYPDWVKGVSVVNGDIVLEAKPTGLVIIVK
ncbi:MAG: hypothetical protein IJI54_07165 [Kiritimatiellae bacterium]|nr:hypothetical protein [Kiritimatiellia bacterium]